MENDNSTSADASAGRSNQAERFGANPPADALHVLYEIEMLLQIVRLQRNNLIKDQLTRNLAIESFAIHARTLVDFFADRTRPDRIKLSDFGLSKCAEESELLPQQSRDRINSEIAHLGYGRNKPPSEKVWDFDKLAAPFCGPCRHFIDTVHTRFRGTETAERARDLFILAREIWNLA